MKRPENKFGDETRKNVVDPRPKYMRKGYPPLTKKIKKSYNLMKRPENKFGSEIRTKISDPPIKYM